MKPTRTAPAARRPRRLAALLSLGLLLALLPARSWAQCTQLVWGDEFNTTALDTTKWKVIVGDGCPTLCGFGNAELQNYRAQNLAVTGGNLIINTKLETTTAPSGNTYQYSSGKLESKVAGLGKLQTFKYGRIEARMQLPSAGGIWPAFWMLADPSNWPYTGEIDIMEAKHKNPSSMTGTAIGDAGGGNPYFASRTYSAGVDLSTGFHVYALEWGPDVLRFYVDGNLYNTVTPQTAGAFPFNDNQFYLILNAAVGGPGSGYTGYIQPTPGDYPTQTLVDYVRIYKGTYNYAVVGDEAVYQNEQYKNYRIDAIAGATYAWTVPAGATIVSGQGTNIISVSWGTTAGNVAVTVTTSGCTTNVYSKAVTMSPALTVEKVYEDFQTNRFLTYGTRTGTLTQALANPASAAPNTSATVGKYVRNPAEQYDVMYVQGLTIGNANDFAQGRKKVYVDVYSSAPVGSRVTMQFENGAVTTATNFPLGRHSSYKAFTTRQNAWETLEFNYEQTIDAGTSIFSINNVAFLFEPGLNTANTFYFDNVQVKTMPAPPIVATDILENYDGTSRISYDAAITNGTYTAGFANPSATGVNTFAHVAKYVRNSTQTYDVLFFNAGPPGTVITDAGKFKDQRYQLQLDLYTDAPVGTSVRITLQNKAAAAPTGSYPAGRNSTYLAQTTVQNGWQTLTLSFDTSPDAGTSNLAIDQLAVLFNGNINTGNTYYLDNLKVVKHVADPTYSAGTLYEDYQATHNITYQTANGTYLATQANPSATGINTSTSVGKYTRNSASTYDALTFASAAVKDGGLFKTGDKVFAMDVYTSAPVGTVISWQLESSAASLPGNYPAGRHSIYQSVVRQTNTWHTLTFTYASTPDGSTTDASVDRIVFLFAPNSTGGDVYYFDNLRSLNKVSTATNVAPTVSLTAPANNATYTAPASVTLTANAADSDGTVSKVEFFNGATLLGTSTSSPYSYTWTGVAAGTYSLTAKATDNSGAATTSAAVSVTVNAAANTPPTVSLTSPANNATFTAPASITLSANAADANGTVSKVDFYQGATLLNSDTSSPYSYAWTGVAAGTYSITAKATDNGGAVTTSAAVSVTVTSAQTTTNLALNKPTFTSSTENAGVPGSAAVDGDASTTRWSSAFADPQWIYVDLGASYNVNRVKMTWEAAYGKDYLVQISTDASTWTTIKTVTGNTTLVNDHTALTGTGRYVRMYGTARAVIGGASYGYSLYELEVYGTAATGGGTGVCTGTVASGDYSYEVSTTSGNVNWKFIPLAPIAGSTMALLYVKAGSATVYSGYQMTASGSSFVYSVPQTSGTALSFYFTYRVGTGTAERNSSATPHSYTVGATCASRTALATTKTTGIVAGEAYPNPVTNQLTIELRGAAIHTITLRDVRGAVVREVVVEAGRSSAGLDMSKLAGGIYLLTISSAEGQEVRKIAKE